MPPCRARPSCFAAIADDSASAAAAALLVTVPTRRTTTVNFEGGRALCAIPRCRFASTRLESWSRIAHRPRTFAGPCDGLKCEDAGVCGLASRALGELGPAAAPAIPALRESLFIIDQPNLEAVDVLAKIGAPAIPVFLEVLDRGDYTVKWQVVRALGNMGEPARAALPALRRLSIQRTMMTAEVKKAIRKLGGDIA